MKDVGVAKYDFQKQDIKSEPVTKSQLEEMRKLVQLNYPDQPPYESLFSKVALKYRALGLNKIQLQESDYQHYILQEYTFLKRPVFIIGKQIFVGNAPKTVAAVQAALAGLS
jgi:arsenate reductase